MINGVYMEKLDARGFTLMELLVAIVIIAVLASIAYPSYDVFIRKTRMEQAKASIMATARDMERFYTKNRTFKGAPAPASTDFFDIAFAASSPGADNYEIIAKPNNKNPNESKGLYYSSTAGSFSRCDKVGMDNCEQF